MDRGGFEPPTCPNLEFFAKGLDDILYPTRLDDRPNGYPTSAGLEKLDSSTLDARSNGSSRGPLKKSAPDRSMKGRWFDGYLKVEGRESEYQSVQRLLDHLSRRTQSESSRIQYLQTVGTLCRREGKNPTSSSG